MNKQLDSKLRDSYDASESIMRTRARSFYQAFKLLPKKRFQAIAAIYAFCRHADDVVDDPFADRSSQRQKLKELEEEVLHYYRYNKLSSSAQEKTWWLALSHTIDHYQIPIDGFLQQLKGQASDMDFIEIETIEQFIQYGRLVAGSVGVLLMPILLKNPQNQNITELHEACQKLGIAMQITNILRDVGEDIRERNRVYLPNELLNKYEVDRALLEHLARQENSPDIPVNFISLWEELAELADAHYVSLKPWLNYFAPEARLPLLSSALLYHAIQDAVRVSGYNCFTQRNYTNEQARKKLIMQAQQALALL